MELRNYVAIVRRRIRVIAIITVVAVLIGGIGTLVIRPVYVASTTLRVRTAASLSASSVSFDSIMYATRLLNTYSKMASARPFLEQVRSRAGLADIPRVTVDVPANSELMTISVENRDPAMAASAANTLSDLLIEQVKALDVSAATSTREVIGEQLAQLQDDQGPPEVRQQQHAQLADEYVRARLAEVVPPDSLYVLEPARAQDATAKPQRTLVLGIALLLGLVGGVGFAFVLENLDTRLYTTRGIENVVNLAVLTAVPGAPSPPTRKFFPSNSPELEAVRRLSAQLCRAERQAADPHRVLVTSALPKEGKSTVAANLAIVLAGTGRTVAVVDCDMRLPAQHEIFGLQNRVGLSSYLGGELQLEAVVHATQVPEVDVITSGPPPANPAELLSSPRLAGFMRELDGWYDIALIDSPSLLAVADTLSLVPLVDRVVLVVGRGLANAEAVRSAREQLIGAGATSIGVVVTHAEPEKSTFSYYRPAASQ